METSRARDLWRLLEVIHATIYFAPECKQSFEDVGLKGYWMGYFASRAAPMGEVSPSVVEATFYNFHPSMVQRAIPDAWSFSSVDRVLAARSNLAETALRRLLGDWVDSPECVQAAELARRAAHAADCGGRPLAAANAGLTWPELPHLVLWHAATILREHRGDGHIAALVTNEIDGCQAHITALAASGAPEDTVRPHRGWPDDEWEVAKQRLRERSLLKGDRLSDAGAELRTAVEQHTDALAIGPYATLGVQDVDRLEELLQAPVRAMIAAGGLPFPNPIGLTASNDPSPS